MPNKEAILDNVEQYSANQLLEFIHSGIVTFDELCTETGGYFPANVRKELEALLAGSEEDDWQDAKESNDKALLGRYLMAYPNGSHRDEARQLIRQLETLEAQGHVNDEWNDVDKDDIDALREFVDEHPDSPHCTEARQLIDKLYVAQRKGSGKQQLQRDIKQAMSGLNKKRTVLAIVKDYFDKNKITHSDFLSIIEEDNNIVNAWVLNELIDGNYISYVDLASIIQEQSFVDQLINKEEPHAFDVPLNPLDSINRKSTEVYFWGIPSSGKSCALGAILSVASNGHVARSMKQDCDCQGYEYMMRLASLFKSANHMAVLPEGTPVTATYAMGFDLEDMQGRVHPLTCIDLAGELFRCMFLSNGNKGLDVDQEKTLNTLSSVLINNRSGNRKMHFFVIEYGAEEKKFDNLKQGEYLDAGLRYIEHTGILKDETDAIFIIITKSDKAKIPNGRTQTDVLKSYIEDNYRGFYNGLTKICKDYEINNGKVEIMPFSLGQVCFQDYCLFDETAANKVVRKLLERTKGLKNGKWSRLINIFRK